MSHSDDYGIDDDDTEFLAAATQADDAFQSSPRPSKRRKLSPSGPDQLNGIDDGDLEDLGSPRASMQVQHGAAQTQTSSLNDPIDDEDVENYYFPGELGTVDNQSKKSKHRIHIPENGGRFPDMIFTQTQHGLDKSLAEFRGAIWKRPPTQTRPNLGGVANARGLATGAVRTGMNGIGNYFQSVGRSKPVEDDAALAARLQAEEDALGKQNVADRQRRAAPGSGSFGSTIYQDLATQLDDLPSDAFSSSSPEKSPVKDVIDLSGIDDFQPTRQQSVALRGPQTGLKQLDIWGKPATQTLTSTQAANKRHAWPLVNKNEPPTHHKLEDEAMKTWIYPTNLGTVRDYQYNIVSRSLFHNTLVALPTGLGKTFIAATIMLNYYRWTKNAQLIFMAPTKPLIAQQMEACHGVVGIPLRDTVLMTGETTPGLRAEEWLEKRVFFMTPQTVINDLKTGICDPKRIVLLIVDEAHKATGGYAYTEVISFMRRFNSSFRVLALTATPGSTVEAVQAVIDNLGIARVELRTEISLDIRDYTHEKQTETEIFDISDEQGRLMELMSKVLKPSLEKLNSQNAYWPKDPMQLTAYGLTTSRQKWMQSDAGRKAPQPVKGMINTIFTVLSKLAHSIHLLKNHGIGPFYSGILAFQKDVTSGEVKGKTATAITQCDDFNKMVSTMRTWTNNPEFIGHPKLEYLREVVLNHFLDAGEGRQGSDVPPSATRIMIFASYRDSTEDICRVLKRSEPMIRPHVFVGQAASKGQEGMDQKRQNAVIQDFKSGKYNTLVATSIGEEGLDIGTVDLIVCYDATSSPIRMLQRVGRTGRKRVGRVVLLLMKGKEENDYIKAQDNYAYIQKTIADNSKYSYRDDESPRILPRDVKPVADKRPVDIPIENSQPVDLNEKGKRGKGKAKVKRPPKKFHMPDGVRTGFTVASKLGADSDDVSEEDKAPKRKEKTAHQKQHPPVFRRLASPPPAPVLLPSITDVFLNDEQLEELHQKYALAVQGNTDPIIRPPDQERFPETLRSLGDTKYIRHGQSALLVEKTMKAAHEVDFSRCQRFEELLHMSDLEEAGPAQKRLVSAEATSSMAVLPQICEPIPAASTVMNPRGRPRKKKPLQRTISYGSAAGEGVESSPEPTPADMRIATQGEDLGSEDTSGEDEEEDPDTEDEAFLAHTSDAVEIISSSQPGSSPARKARGLKRKLVRTVSLAGIEEENCSEKESIVAISDDENDEPDEPAVKTRRNRVVQDSDDDDNE